MKLPPFAAVGLIVAVSACGTTQPEEASTSATAVRVLSSNGVKGILDDLRPRIESAIGHPLSIEFSTSTALKAKIDGGEPFDVAILVPALLHELASQGHLVGDSHVNIARTGVGVGSREGAPRADVSTPEALKRTLLNAKSVAFTAEGQSRPFIEAAFEKLGIVEAMRPKVMLVGPAGGPIAVAKGEAELVMTLTSEIIPVPGVQLLGPLPGELQQYVSFGAARSAHAKDPEAADALLRELNGPVVTSALESHGMESVE
ncbi:MAG TPA: substrate-binding domain-containing protein [Vicinamibacterales bacterium]